mgnify:CR=1 FL=1
MDISSKLELLEQSKKTFDKLIVELRKRGYILAKAEREYRKALAKREIVLRDNKYPSNLAGDIARGQESDLRYKRDIAELEFEIVKDQLRNERMQIEALRSTLAFDRATYLNQ